MSIEFLKTIRETEKVCEKKLEQAEKAKQNAIEEAEKQQTLKLREAENSAKSDAENIIAEIKTKIEQQYIKALNDFEQEQSLIKEKAKKIEEKAIDIVLKTVL